jgi:Carboxypeptidase regulatory-like domain
MFRISIPGIYSVLVTSLLVCSIASAPAQTANTGAISGTVFDPSGAVVREAEVVIRSEAQKDERNLLTAAEGEFSAPLLNPGNYEIAIRAQGFERLVVHGVPVRITEVTRVRLPLTIASAKQRVGVSASSPLLQTENATLGRVSR